VGERFSERKSDEERRIPMVEIEKKNKLNEMKRKLEELLVPCPD
jgi:hypothetical protein